MFLVTINDHWTTRPGIPIIPPADKACTQSGKCRMLRRYSIGRTRVPACDPAISADVTDARP